MKGLHFQRLVLLSDSKKLGNQFSFPKRFNLVTGKDNSIGKSTLVKSLFWAIGCDPQFDQEWKSNDVKAILYFKINEVDYIVSRYQDIIYFGKSDSLLDKYSRVTGEFAQAFAKVTGFDLLLANRQNGLDCPPPAFYFLPFYIDQKRSWDEPWNGFENLAQYSNFRRNLIKYFCGYLSPNHFEIEEEIFEQKAKQNAANHQVNRITAAIEVLEEIAPAQTIAITLEELESIQSEIKQELQVFSHQQFKLYEQQSILANEIHDLEQQCHIAIASAKELDEDYRFAVENVPSNSLECPLCGVEHDNSLLSRAGLLADREALEQQASNIRAMLNEKYEQQGELIDELSLVSSEIDRINDKYLSQYDDVATDEQAAFEQALHVVSQNKVNYSVAQTKEGYQLQSKEAQDQQKKLKADQRKLLKKKDKDELNEMFMGNLTENIETLSAKGVNLNGVKSPVDYKKILGGGAAEGTRGTLAYQLAILRQIEHAAHCELAPFVIDTPNQQEQAEHRYKSVLDVIRDNVPGGYQVILCAMDNEALYTYKQDSHIIELDGDRLLQRAHYETLRSEYDEVVLVRN
ncbi:hypothetical protein SAMN03080615_01022 [Amphritea atlantica]|uniref:AAA domain-containing protein n=1 Tax=Amphritea atlantica TaxID=355243 RepID=A0A1H9ESD1_9GAMM|nr:hypothetical protein [Amphritea atlantica]SEQ27918.1 hypothetical protein SAMN03080615_01022 [Amphritea atlantica]